MKFHSNVKFTCSCNTSHKFWDQSPSYHYQFCLQVSETVSWHKLQCRNSANILQLWVERRGLIYFYCNPLQNSVKDRSAWDEVGAQKFTTQQEVRIWALLINIFHIVKHRLRQDILDQQISRENFAVFSARVKTTLEAIPIGVVNRTIFSMGKRISAIIKRKRQRTKY